MPRIRKSTEPEAKTKRQKIWKVGKYIRLSREDGNVISESVVNQDKILQDEIPNFFEDGFYEVIDTYIDDGTSGTTDIERGAFQRMVCDVKSGRINCIIVKNLSRAFRNSANQGHFLEEFIPLYSTRFISLYQPRIDTFLDPEIVHSLEVSITGFMNEQYAYKTSADIRRTFRHKRENGEFIGAFAPYGYRKDPENRNALLIDEEAAQVVRDIFKLFCEGMSKNGIAKRLNELGIPSPIAYKRGKGLHFECPQAAKSDGLWCPASVARILKNSAYIGTMTQGKQKVVSYKVHQRKSVPEDEWYVVENIIPPIVSRDVFDMAQSLHGRDTRTPPGGTELYLFSGFIRCADCKKSMSRKTSKNLTYYVCRTFREKSKSQCGNHSIREDILESAVLTAIKKQIELVSGLEDIIEEINSAPVVNTESSRLNDLLKDRKRELEKATGLLDSLYMDWKSGDISHEQYLRMKPKLTDQVGQLKTAISHIENERAKLANGVDTQDPYLTAFLKYRNVQTLSRGLLAELVKTIYVHENKEIEIEFNFQDQYQRILEFVKSNESNNRFNSAEQVS